MSAMFRVIRNLADISVDNRKFSKEILSSI
jgi:hypothetical protein